MLSKMRNTGKCDKTTVAGMVGGAALAVAALPDSPETVTGATGVKGAAPIGALGWQSKSCRQIAPAPMASEIPSANSPPHCAPSSQLPVS